MEIRKVINEYLPETIPCFTYLDDNNEVKNRIFYGFIPEDECITPACAYLISGENSYKNLNNEEYLKTYEIKFAILSESIIELDKIKCEFMGLCKRDPLPSVQYVRYTASADAEPDLTLQHNLVGVEMSFLFTMK